MKFTLILGDTFPRPGLSIDDAENFFKKIYGVDAKDISVEHNENRLGLTLRHMDVANTGNNDAKEFWLFGAGNVRLDIGTFAKLLDWYDPTASRLQANNDWVPNALLIDRIANGTNAVDFHSVKRWKHVASCTVDIINRQEYKIDRVKVHDVTDVIHLYIIRCSPRK